MKRGNYKHGLSTNPLYYRWNGMRDRCNNKNSPLYKYYGERGIKVCDEWQNDFLKFYTWAINNGYKINLEIDRIDNDESYCPENCRFVNHFIQMNNRRNALLINNKKNILLINNRSSKLHINEFCKLKRISLNISQKELAQKINIRAATISDFEQNKTGLNSNILESIFKELNVKLVI